MKQFLTRICIIASIALIFSPSSNAALSPVENSKSITITVQLYSSRSDPSFELKQESGEVDQIKAFIEKSPRIDFKGKCIPSRLGYHGVMIDNPERVSGLPGHVLIYNGIIEIVGRKKEHRSDQHRALEKFLLKEAEKARVIGSDLIQ